MDSTDDMKANHAWWQERARLHPESTMYRPWLEGLRQGKPALFDLEQGLVGPVEGKRLLHVPCHIGHDTLSWALLGAEVTGVDFSENALDEARKLAADLSLPADWVRADACRLPDSLDGRFDVVVSTYGAYGWMADLQGWLDGVSRALVPGGRFVLVDGHPWFVSLDPEQARQGKLVLVEPAMGGEPVREDRSGTYAQDDLETRANRSVGWCHGIGELVQACLEAGLRIESVDEHDWMVWQQLPTMVADDRGRYRMPEPWHGRVPLMLSIVASKR